MPKMGIALVALATAGVYMLTRDAGVTLTFPFAAAALFTGRGTWLRNLLAISWMASLILSVTNTIMATIVFSYAMLDLAIAGAAVAILTADPGRNDARFIGGLSMAAMPAHWLMSATHGAASWEIYAWALNIIFALQCLTITGSLDRVGGSVRDFLARLHPVHLFRSRGR